MPLKHQGQGKSTQQRTYGSNVCGYSAGLNMESLEEITARAEMKLLRRMSLGVTNVDQIKSQHIRDTIKEAIIGTGKRLVH